MIDGVFNSLRRPPVVARFRYLHARKVFVYAFADQALLSAVNFLTMVILGRALGPSHFGSFVLIWGILLFFGNLQAAVVTQPLLVLLPGKDSSLQSEYATAVLVLQGCLLIATTAALLTIGAAGHHFRVMSWEMLVSAAFALIATQLQEFSRRLFYGTANIPSALPYDVISYGGQIAILILVCASHHATPTSAMLAISAPSLLAAAGAFYVQRKLFSPNPKRTYVTETFSFGKWLAGGQIVYWLADQFYFYAAAFVLGPAAVGGLRACQVLLSPLNLLFSLIDSLVPSRLAELAKENDVVAFALVLRTVSRITVAAIGLLAATTTLVASQVLARLFGNEYAEFENVLRFMGLFYLTIGLTRIWSGGLRSLFQSRATFYAYSVGASTGIPLALILPSIFGVVGSALGLLLSGIAISLTLYVFLRRSICDMADQVAIRVAPRLL